MKARLAVLFVVCLVSLGGLASSIAQPAIDVVPALAPIEQGPTDPAHPNNNVCPPPKHCAAWADPPYNHICTKCV